MRVQFDSTASKIESLLASQKTAHSLQQSFYVDQDIYQHEIDKLFLEDWWYVCHVSQVAAVGDCFTYDMANESAIVTRDENGDLNAFANVCRHRGSRLCDAGASKALKLVCPYHAWTYGLNGELQGARQLPKSADASTLGLKHLALQEVCGLVFVSFSDNPPAFDQLLKELPQALAVFDLPNTEVAHYENHPIEGNWKLVMENFDECYHCAPAHKEFALSHSIMLDFKQQEKYDALIAKRAPECGMQTAFFGVRQAEALAKHQTSYYYDRYALFEGYLTGSQDGNAIAPLLGTVRGYDSGASNVQIGAFTYLLIYCDHAVIYRFTPRGVNLTDAEVIWLVRKGAEELVNYDLDHLKWLWSVTTQADKDIIERNQLGVLSRFYEPGPYTEMEEYTQDFVEWYLQAIT
jgi:phenylpropionate dioxygenase-like ring-hydroxylating dioxygenase large terminal subunit